MTLKCKNDLIFVLQLVALVRVLAPLLAHVVQHLGLPLLQNHPHHVEPIRQRDGVILESHGLKINHRRDLLHQ